MKQHQLYGYARVSTKEQHEDRQLLALKEFGVADKDVFVEKLSGKDFNRPVYRRLVKRLKEGDTLVVKSIDRLGRDYEEILEQWRVIGKELKAYIVVLDMPLLDTRKKDIDLTGTFVADLVLQILSYAAQTERLNIRSRQAEGIAAAKLKGVRLGRPPKERPAHLGEYAAKWQNGELTAWEAAELLGIAESTFRRWAKQDK
ncbi:MAG: recombinase family protein [Clostridiales bacterium]|jgi:DNA invertase Pin-like site-specific DNA recombinase|nr:recombinase family protein [Clostridiales bacterium]